MSIIKTLPDTLVNQIAAGEVVERPSSVVKELVENSLDSGAKKISIELKDAGKTLIKISDDGKGMDREDLILALQRHATSKIFEEADLWKIKTMGFRGEALASISSVSKFTMRSRAKNELSGWEINSDGGNLVNMQEVGMSEGTTVFVRELFYNTPARQKFLKKDATELAQITALLNSIALANPNVNFQLIHNGKTIFDLMPATDLKSRIADLFGQATTDAMLPVFYQGSAFQIDGFIGKPVLSRSGSQHQYFLVNNRPIQHFLLANTIKQAYHSMLMEGKKPIFVINIKIDPGLIDVNVHPRKLEIRFEDQQSMVRIIYGTIKTALEKENLMPKRSESERYMSDKNFAGVQNGNLKAASFAKNSFYDKASNIQEAMSFTKNLMETRDSQNLYKEPILKAISQVADSYIVAQNAEGLILIDQHAAHERVRYEELMNQFENEKKSVQPLLVPMQMEFSHDEAIILEDNINIFTSLGFEIENFGGKTYMINTVPSFLSKEDLDNVMRGVLDDITAEKGPSKFQGKTEEIINYMACRSAIKFGKKLELSEMQILIDQMQKLKRPYTCPHGRPTMISLSLSELERMFGRK